MPMDFYLRSKDRLPGTYLYFVPAHTKVASILTSRGCPYNCIFCHNTWKGMPYRFNSAERVISEIEGLISRYGVKAIFFIEDNFFANKPRVETICKMMIKSNLNIIWGANARVDNIDLEILTIAREAGCRQVTFGFESGSQKILDILNKKTTVKQNQQAIELCKQVGIIPQGTFMIGNPEETVEDIRATQDFIKNNKIESAGICLTTPYPGTELWNWCRQRQRIPQHLNWKDFDYRKVAIPVCNSIPKEEIKRLFLETVEIVSRNSPLKFSRLLITSLRYPNQAISWIRRALGRPATLRNLLHRIKI
jgi:tRNA A37 methylthiotransferase MiaB